MQRSKVPANVAILAITPERLRPFKQTRSLDIFDGSGTNFHEEGLFSISTFGRVGSEERDQRFSFIDLRTEVFHPFIYKNLCQLKGLYKGIMTGKAYAVWDDKEKDFVAATPIEGQTGYFFFMSKWREIVFKRTGSDIRDLRIQLINKYKDSATTRYVVVMPAGLRDIQIDKDGRIKQSEINEFYRSLISISNTITTTAGGVNEIIDTSRIGLQNTFNKLYDYIIGLLEGKGGFIQQKWGARRIQHGTRNVFTTMDTSQPILGENNAPGINDTVVSLFQTMKGALPKAKYYILNGWISKIFNGPEGNAVLVNPKTLRREVVSLPSKVIDLWTTTSGIDKIIASYWNREFRTRPVMVEDYYIGLVYRGPDNTFKFFGDITELPPGDKYSKEYVHPISLCELLYLSGYREWNKLAMYVTRYPVTGMGSIYPSSVYVKNTVPSEVRQELDDNWQPMGEDFTANEYPVMNEATFVDSMSPHPSRMGGLQGDYDGDMGSGNYLMTDQALMEVQNQFNSAAFYLNPKGGLQASPMIETVERVLVAFTGD